MHQPHATTCEVKKCDDARGAATVKLGLVRLHTRREGQKISIREAEGDLEFV